MREFKFRVWDKENNKMELVGALDWDGNYRVVTCNTETTKLYKLGHEDIDFVLMQYVGLHDKNYVEIFEGDIVKNINTNNYWKVIFTDSSFKLERIANPNDDLRLVEEYDGWLIIIGNIYENKELLKG